MYLEKAFEDAGFASNERLPVARILGETRLTFLVDPARDRTSMWRVVDAVDPRDG